MTQSMDEGTIRTEAAAPMSGIVIIFTEGPWGTGGDAVPVIRAVAEDHGLHVDAVHTGDGMVRVWLTGGGMTDMDYLSAADDMFSRLGEYLPQMITVTEGADGQQ